MSLSTLIKTGVKTIEVGIAEVAGDAEREVLSLVRNGSERFDEADEIARNVKNCIGDKVDDLQDVIAGGLGKLLYPDITEEDPVAEMQFRNPRGGQMVSLGCKLTVIQNSHVIKNIQSGSIAHKLNLRENDVIIEIEKKRVSNWPIGQVLQHLATMETSFTLVIKRKKPNSNNEYVYIAIRITLSIEGDTITAEVVGTYFIKPSPVYGEDVELAVTGHSFDAYVYQDHSNSPTSYLNVLHGEPRVTPISTSSDDLFEFRVHQLQGWERTAFIITNDTIHKVIKAPGPTGDALLTNQDNEDGLDGIENGDNSDITADETMFYVHTGHGDYFQYESVIHQGSFLAAENGRLVLVQNPGGDISRTLFKTTRTEQLDPMPPALPPQEPNPAPQKPDKPNMIQK